MVSHFTLICHGMVKWYLCPGGVSNVKPVETWQAGGSDLSQDKQLYNMKINTHSQQYMFHGVIKQYKIIKFSPLKGNI